MKTYQFITFAAVGVALVLILGVAAKKRCGCRKNNPAPLPETVTETAPEDAL